MSNHGGLRPGAGRPKGARDKMQRAAKEQVWAVFEKLGGVDAMWEWAQENRRDFYVSIWSKLLPKSVDGEINHFQDRTVAEMPDAELLRVISGGAGNNAG